ncbi:MAG: ferrous iron transporter B [Clostridium sp.]|nr:ferrous iron transporter B [Clostridium sp.]
MVYETFLNNIQSLVQARFGSSADVSVRRVLKNNGLLLDGLTISSPLSKTAPTIYLNSYYEEQEGSGFLLIELPEYRLPEVRTLIYSVWEREKEYLVKAGTVICSASVLMWILLHTGRAGFCAELSESFGAVLGGWLSPLLRPAGLGDWQTAVALLSGLTAKEVVASSFFVLYGIPDMALSGGGNSARLASALGETGFGAANACALMAFCLFYPPCMAALGVICKESDSFLWTAGMVLLELAVAWAAAVAVFQAGSVMFG